MHRLRRMPPLLPSTWGVVSVRTKKRCLGRDRQSRSLLTLVESFNPAAERVTSGEFPIAITYVYYVYLNGIKGAPIDYVRTGKFLGDASYLTLHNKAPHPNAAKAFIDFFLDEESMSIMAKAGEFVNRKGIYPPVPDADKIQFVEMDDLGEKVYAEKRKEFHKLFLQ